MTNRERLSDRLGSNDDLSPQWWQEQAERATASLLSMRYELLGPAGRLLVNGIRVERKHLRLVKF